jgi:hypothetical protein
MSYPRLCETVVKGVRTIFAMVGNDLVRQSALEKPTYEGKFLSTFSYAEAFFALSLSVTYYKALNCPNR